VGKEVKTATFMRKLSGFRGNAALYRVDPKMIDNTGKRYQYVVASAVQAYSGPETLIFGADDDGEIANWSELDGGRGYLSHEDAFIEADYEVRIQEIPE